MAEEQTPHGRHGGNEPAQKEQIPVRPVRFGSPRYQVCSPGQRFQPCRQVRGGTPRGDRSFITPVLPAAGSGGVPREDVTKCFLSAGERSDQEDGVQDMQREATRPPGDGPRFMQVGSGGREAGAVRRPRGRSREGKGKPGRLRPPAALHIPLRHERLARAAGGHGGIGGGGVRPVQGAGTRVGRSPESAWRGTGESVQVQRRQQEGQQRDGQFPHGTARFKSMPASRSQHSASPPECQDSPPSAGSRPPGRGRATSTRGRGSSDLSRHQGRKPAGHQEAHS